MALRAQRDGRPGVAALRVNIIESKELSPGGTHSGGQFHSASVSKYSPSPTPQSGMWKPTDSSLDRSSAEWTGRGAMEPSVLVQLSGVPTGTTLSLLPLAGSKTARAMSAST